MSDIKSNIKLAWNRKQAQQNLKEKLNSELMFAHQGGMWCADRSTISFLSAFPNISEMVVEDVYGIPRKVNPMELLDLCKQKYQYATNAWAVEYQKLARTRRADDL